MTRLSIDPSELYPPDTGPLPPRAGATVAEWAVVRGIPPRPRLQPPEDTPAPAEPVEPPPQINPHRPGSYKAIIWEVAILHGLTFGDLMASSRNARVVAARHEAMYRIRAERVVSLSQIARAVGLRDHTTVLHGIRRYCARTGAEIPPGPTLGWTRRKAVQA